MKRDRNTPGRTPGALRTARRSAENTPTDLARMVELARHRSADAREVLLEAVYYWVLDNPAGPVPDQARVRRRVERHLAGLADALRAEIARQGLTPADLDARLAWSEGRTEHLLATPTELDDDELDLLCQGLKTTMNKVI